MNTREFLKTALATIGLASVSKLPAIEEKPTKTIYGKFRIEYDVSLVQSVKGKDRYKIIIHSLFGFGYGEAVTYEPSLEEIEYLMEFVHYKGLDNEEILFRTHPVFKPYFEQYFSRQINL